MYSKGTVKKILFLFLFALFTTSLNCMQNFLIIYKTKIFKAWNMAISLQHIISNLVADILQLLVPSKLLDFAAAENLKNDTIMLSYCNCLHCQPILTSIWIVWLYFKLFITRSSHAHIGCYSGQEYISLQLARMDCQLAACLLFALKKHLSWWQ